MAYKDFDDLSLNLNAGKNPTTLEANGQTVDLPDASFVRDADMTRDGMDLVLEGPDGALIIEGYFAAEPAPNLVAPDGSMLTPELVESFAKSPAQFAQNLTMTDESPVGAVEEMSGEITVIRTDGTVEIASIGTPIFQGDVIETSADGAVNIVFIDETSFAVSEDARLAIDEYVFDPTTQSGSTNFSVLKGVFVFTSGLIGREDPDDVEIDTPIGSIGIRGTIIAGDVDSGEITVVEGAIVLRDHQGNEVTLANQFETAKFNPSGDIEHLGQVSANDLLSKFASISGVAAGLFSSIDDALAEQADAQSEAEEAADDEAVQEEVPAEDSTDETLEEAPVEEAPAEETTNEVIEETPAEEAAAEEMTAEEVTTEDVLAEDATENIKEPAAEDPTLTESGSAPESTEFDAEVEDISQETTTTEEEAAATDTTESSTTEPLDTTEKTTTTTTSWATEDATTSDNSGSGSTSSGSGSSGSDPTTTTTTEDNSGSDSTSSGSGSNEDPATNSPDPATDPNALPPPPFELVVLNVASFDEEVTPGGPIARISSTNGEIQNLNIMAGSKFADKFALVDNGNGTWDVYLTQAMDYDTLAERNLLSQFGPALQAISTDGQTDGLFVRADIQNVNENPFHVPTAFPNEPNVAPDGLFVGHSGGTFSYEFGKEFHDKDFGDNLTFELSSAAMTELNNLVTTDPGGNALPGAYLSNWNFDPNTGVLTVTFANTGWGVDPSFSTSNFEIRATDSGGLDTGFQIYTLTGYDLFGAIPLPGGNYVGSNQVLNDPNNTNAINILSGASDNIIFMGIGNDNVIVNFGASNSIYLEDGMNTVSSFGLGGVTDTTIYGGDQTDVFTINNSVGTNQFYGMSGDDIFNLVLSASNNLSQLGTWGQTTEINGGDSGFRAANALRNQLGPDAPGFTFDPSGFPPGRGDSLVFVDGGAIDFGAIDNNYIKSIERIDTQNGTGNSIILNYSDVIAMTDFKKALIINGDGSDALTFNNDIGGTFSNIGTITVDDKQVSTATTADDTTFNVYSDGQVTLLVDTELASVTGLPGA